MAKNEDGEFELILGNRQLISVFLIVVILLGVFFSMGYIVGRNSAPTVAENTHDSKPAVIRYPPQSSEPSSAEAAKMADATASGSTPAPAPEPASTARGNTGTHPARDVEPPAPAGPGAPPQKSKSSTLAPPTSVTGDLAPGDYWQVVATARPDAEIITEALGKKGFHAVMAPAPKEGIFRVLVGPLRDPATQAQTRTALEAAGFKNPIVRKY